MIDTRHQASTVDYLLNIFNKILLLVLINVAHQIETCHYCDQNWSNKKMTPGFEIFFVAFCFFLMYLFIYCIYFLYG